MYGDFFLLQRDDEPAMRAERLAFGQTSGRDEAWLRDTLFQYPELLPIGEIDPSYGPLIPLCKELRTPAGPLDLAYVNPQGRLTLVECKLWRNPESRRKVVAQILDYARGISRWTYADLQRQVAMATGSKGNVPFERASAVAPGLSESRFVDQVSVSMQSGRFLMLIAGDGIREDISGIAELINRNASGFTLALIEVGLYTLADGALVVQPRTLARTRLMERTVVLLRDEGVAAVPSRPEQEDDAPVAVPELSPTSDQLEYRAWWRPLQEMQFDDPDQEPPTYAGPNRVRSPLPTHGTWLTAYRSDGDTGEIGVFVSGTGEPLKELGDRLCREKADFAAELPAGSVLETFKRDGIAHFITKRATADFPDDDSRRRWLAETLNDYANVFRARLQRSLNTVTGG